MPKQRGQRHDADRTKEIQKRIERDSETSIVDDDNLILHSGYCRSAMTP